MRLRFRPTLLPAASHVIFSLMRHLRMSGLPAILLSLLTGFAFFLPEVGHSLAHRRSGLHASHEAVGHVEGHQLEGAAVSGSEAEDTHPHFDLVASPPGRPLLAFAIAAPTILWSFPEPYGGIRVASLVARTLAPVQNYHGPPPATRAPPLV